MAGLLLQSCARKRGHPPCSGKFYLQSQSQSQSHGTVEDKVSVGPQGCSFKEDQGDWKPSGKPTGKPSGKWGLSAGLGDPEAALQGWGEEQIGG